MKQKKTFALIIGMIFLGFVSGCKDANQNNNSLPSLKLSELPLLGEVSDRYQSVNIEMCEVVGGDFWVPYQLIDTARVRAEGFTALKHKIPPIDLYNPKLRNLASALGPMYVRVSGTWANTTYFQDNDNHPLSEAPHGFENVLTRKAWKGVIDFCKAVDANLVTSFTISEGIRDGQGNWTPIQAAPLLAYTQSIGGEIAAAEMFNEPSHAEHGGAPEGYNAAYYARDFLRFKKYVDSIAPEMKIMGPGSTGEGGIIPVGEAMTTDKLLSADPKPEFDIFSYHFYGGVSARCRGGLNPENALSQEWLSRTELGLQYYEQARDQYLPKAPIWLTETAEAACGGNPWAATYIDTFRYLEQLGRLARKGVQVVMHNTLNASEYALLEQETHDPRPNYWAALLWNRFMGTMVYDAAPLAAGIDIFVHNRKGDADGRTALVINTTGSTFTFEIPLKAKQVLLSAHELTTKTVMLNGGVLQLNADDTLPEIHGLAISEGEVQIPSHGIMFLVFDKL